MTAQTSKPMSLSRAQARLIWLRAQRLDETAPFGSGPEATRAAIEHLGYVQIDTINVIERCHHHILWSRIPEYRRAHLRQAQSVDKSVFEYWTHALSYIPARDLRFFIADMREHRDSPRAWFASVSRRDLSKLVARIRREGAISIRDIDDDALVEKDHAWASRKPSKRVLQLGFYAGLLTISERVGMVKSYELIERHFGWETRPRAAATRDTLDYLLDRALRSQGIVSLDSICHLAASRKPAIHALIQKRMRRKTLVPVDVDGAGKTQHWARPETLDLIPGTAGDAVHILSPFDPLVIQRKRLSHFFGYDHLFEAYVPKEKRRLGYFALPVLIGDEVVAAIDAKTDRAARTLLIQSWTWIGKGPRKAQKAAIEDALGRFERFQFGD